MKTFKIFYTFKIVNILYSIFIKLKNTLNTKNILKIFY